MERPNGSIMRKLSLARSRLYRERPAACRPRSCYGPSPLFGWLRLRREPVLEDLFGSVCPRAHSRCAGRVDLAIFLQFGYSLARSALQLRTDGGIDLAPEGRTILNNRLDFDPCIADRLDPAASKLSGRGIFEFEQMFDNPAKLAFEFASLGDAQALDFLG